MEAVAGGAQHCILERQSDKLSAR